MLEICECRGSLGFRCRKCGGSGYVQRTENIWKYRPAAYPNRSFLGNGDEAEEYRLEASVFGYEDKPLFVPPKFTVKEEPKPIKPVTPRLSFRPFFSYRPSRPVETIRLWRSPNPPFADQRFPFRKRWIGDTEVIHLNNDPSAPIEPRQIVEPPRFARNRRSRPRRPFIPPVARKTGFEILGSLVRKIPTLQKQVWAQSQ